MSFPSNADGCALGAPSGHVFVSATGAPVSATIGSVEALGAIDGWKAGQAAAGVARGDGVVATHGPRDVALPWASVTKLLTGLAMLVALEEGTVDLDEPAGPPG